MRAQPTHIGSYEILQPLGQGGMGTVYLARDPAIDRLVALKLLREGLDSPELRERFHREARAAGKLRHPNIVTIFHIGEHQSQPYIVMEYIPGKTVADIIDERQPLGTLRKLQIVEDLCNGLAYAHKAGIVHRDIKPANIIVDSDGLVKILDFGIARAGDPGMTRLGTVMGTPRYMAPEQLDSGIADARSDEFSVGIVLYELLTYTPAFSGDPFAVMHKILSQEPEPIERFCRGIDPAIPAIVKRAMSKDARARYQDLSLMRAELARVAARLSDQMNGDTVMDGLPKDSGSLSGTGVSEPADRRLRPESGDTASQVLVAEARRLFDNGEFQRAIDLCEQIAPEDTGYETAVDLIRVSRRRLTMRKARAILETIRDHMARGDFGATSQGFEDASVLDLSGDTAVGLRLELADLKSDLALARQKSEARERDIAARVARAKQSATTEAFDAALEELRSAPDDPRVRDARAEIEELRKRAFIRAEQQRSQDNANRIVDEIDRARRLGDAGDPTAALAILGGIRLAPAELPVGAVERLRAEAAALTAHCESTRCLRDAHRELAAGRLAEASRLVEHARTWEVDHPDLDLAVRAIADASEANRRERRLQQLDALTRQVASAQAAAAQGDSAGALQQLNGIQFDVPELAGEPGLADLERLARDLKAAAERDQGTVAASPPVATPFPGRPESESHPRSKLRDWAEPLALRYGAVVILGIALLAGAVLWWSHEPAQVPAPQDRVEQPSPSTNPRPPIPNPTPPAEQASLPPARGEQPRTPNTARPGQTRGSLSPGSGNLPPSPRAANNSPTETNPGRGRAQLQPPNDPGPSTPPTSNVPSSASTEVSQGAAVEGANPATRGSAGPLDGAGVSGGQANSGGATAAGTGAGLAVNTPPTGTDGRTGGGPVDTRAGDERAVQQALNQYVAAYNAMDSTAVSKVYPAQRPVDFTLYRSFKLTLGGVRIDIEGNTATVTCIRQIDTVVVRGNQNLRTSPATTFKLHRAGASWLIDSVQ